MRLGLLVWNLKNVLSRPRIIRTTFARSFNNSPDSYSHNVITKYGRPQSRVNQCCWRFTTWPTTRTLASSLSKTNLGFHNERVQKYIASLMSKYESALARMSSLSSAEEKTESVDTSAMKDFYQQLKPLAERMKALEALNNELKELNSLIEGLDKSKDAELLKLAMEDKQRCEENKEEMEHLVFELLIPEETIDDSDIIIEVHAGVGGQEAMLFAQEIFDMYCNYVQRKGWSHDIIEYDQTDIGGLRHAVLSVNGQGAFRCLKYEGGVHRVQRVPKTEKSGRIHTSTVAVWVLPQPSEIEVQIDPGDLIIETKRSSGAGGQHVNKTDTCVRITHIPSGIVTECQVHRTQVENKKLAMKTLRARLYERKLQEQMAQQAAARKLQVASNDRSEKVRTYNFLQDRVTDHRLTDNIHGLELFLSGGDKLDDLIESLIQKSQMQKLEQVLRSQNL